MCWKMWLLLECVAHHRNIFSHSDLALHTDPCIGLGETRGRVSGNNIDIGIRRLVRILAHTCGYGHVSQTHGTSVVTAVKGGHSIHATTELLCGLNEVMNMKQCCKLKSILQIFNKK